MLNKSLNKIMRNERGITGLETAIILIAFVVVAAVFAYTALSAGLFATQKASEAIYSGLREARSTLELKGSVVATANSTGSSGDIKQISFIVSNVLGGEAIDFTAPTADGSNTGLAASGSSNKVVLSYIDQDQQFHDLYWTITKLGDADDDDLLEMSEKFEITVGDSDGASGGNLTDVLTTALTINKTFTIELKPPIGAVLNIERTTPAYIDTVMNLH